LTFGATSGATIFAFLAGALGACLTFGLSKSDVGADDSVVCSDSNDSSAESSVTAAALRFVADDAADFVAFVVAVVVAVDLPRLFVAAPLCMLAACACAAAACLFATCTSYEAIDVSDIDTVCMRRACHLGWSFLTCASSV
jgi:hypothetical protein